MQIQTDIVFRSRTFQVIVSLFAMANIWSWLRHRLDQACCDQEATIGFPVPFHISGGSSEDAGFYLLGLLLDLAVIATIALIATWIEQLVRSLYRD